MLAVALSVLVALLSKAFWSGIMMVCQPTVLAGGFVRDALEMAILNMLTSQNQNMATIT
jgi:hypothetical protein